MDAEERRVRARQFVEEVGVLFEAFGGQRMMGRVLGRLLMCDPPHQSAAELADWLDASRGAISMTTRQLIAAGMVEKLALPADRNTYYRLRRNAWTELMAQKTVAIRMIAEMADRGLPIVEGSSPSAAARLTEMRDFYRFMDEQLSRLFGDWRSRPPSV